MPKRTALIIAGLTFESKSKAVSFFRSIIDRYDSGTELTETDFKHVIALAREKWDPEASAKAEAVIVDTHPFHSQTKCFHIVIDGYLHLFSYLIAINGAPSNFSIFSRACRQAVAPRLREYKKSVFKNRPVRCALTNEVVEWEDCQIDHKAPLTFSVIVKSFIVATRQDLNAVQYTFDRFVDEFAAEQLANQFRDFHEQMAVLRVLSKGSNRRLSSSARLTPTKKDTVLHAGPSEFGLSAKSGKQ